MKTVKDGTNRLVLSKNGNALLNRLDHQMTLAFLDWLVGQAKADKSRYRSLSFGTRRWVFMVIRDDLANHP